MKWEYLINPVGGNQHALNELGQDGWEMVAAYRNEDIHGVGYFIRPIYETKEYPLDGVNRVVEEEKTCSNCVSNNVCESIGGRCGFWEPKELKQDKAIEEPELKPCPFCGCIGRPEQFVHQDDLRVHFILCSQCTSKTANYETRQEAITAWNKRV